MSSAKPTPQYVKRIPAPNIHLVGGATAEAQVIPIRRVTPAYVPTIEAPAKPAPAPRRATRFVPVERRPWLVLLVPPTPGSQTRSFGVARWHAQMVVAALVVTLVLAGGAVAAVAGAVDAQDMFGNSEVDQLRDRLELLEDSLTLARAQLATDDEAVGDSLYDVVPGAAIPMPVNTAPTSTAARLAARKPLLARPERTRDENGVTLAPRSIEGLPVIGRLASGFSRSRRHPVLHIRRPHLGVDVAAPRGTHIIAPAAGKVTFVGRKFGFGIVVEMDHGAGVRTRYAHLTASMVHVGDEIAKGTFIATVGSTGITTGPHLHYEVLVNGHQVDPLRYRLPQQTPQDNGATLPPAVPEPTDAMVPDVGSIPTPTSGAHETISPTQIPAPR